MVGGEQDAQSLGRPLPGSLVQLGPLLRGGLPEIRAKDVRRAEGEDARAQ